MLLGAKIKEAPYKGRALALGALLKGVWAFLEGSKPFYRAFKLLGIL